MTPTGAVEQAPSPNHGPRSDGAAVDILLIHYTGMTSGAAALDWLCSPESQVSSHYLIFEDGRTVQLVDESRRAWHAGRGRWHGNGDINSRSVGIELVHPGHEHGYRAFADAQIVALIALCRGILSRHPIPPDRVLAHSDIAPDRKEDPGELFPWQRLHQEGIGHWVAPAPIAEGPSLGVGDQGRAIHELQAALQSYGYDIEPTWRFDERTEAVVTAFQRHFRQERVDGVADGATVATLERLIAALR